MLGRDRSSHSTRSRARKSHKRSSMGVLPIRETAGADAVTIGLAVAEGEKWCCAAACVKVHGASQCTATAWTGPGPALIAHMARRACVPSGRSMFDSARRFAACKRAHGCKRAQ